MAPIIDVSFTADVQCGVSPLTVQFTDTTQITDGFARFWLWDFGDGSISTDQNPSHIFNGSSGEGFNVTLTVLATEGEFDALSFGDRNATAVSGTEQNGTGDTEQEAWDDYIASSPVSFSQPTARHALTRTGGVSRQYKRQENTLRFSSAFDDSLYIVWVSPSTFTSYQGAATANGFSISPSTDTARQFHSILAGVTAIIDVDLFCTVEPEGQVADTPLTNNQSGLSVFWGLRTFPPTATQDFSDNTEASFVSIATLPVAGFTAVPTLGADPLSVQFANTTIQSDCGPVATYSWKKRISGSGDAFVEFSTSENPLESFTK